MLNQPSLFDLAPTREAVAAPEVGLRSKAPREALPRLSGARLRVLDRLRIGPATNAELLAVGGFRYGARLHELRQIGFSIESEQIDPAAGSWRFTLRSPEPHQ